MTIKPFIALPSFLLMALLASATCFGMEHEQYNKHEDYKKINLLIDNKITIITKIFEAKGPSETLIREATKLHKILDDANIRVPQIKNRIDLLIAMIRGKLDPASIEQKYTFSLEQQTKMLQQAGPLLALECNEENNIKILEDAQKKLEILFKQAQLANCEIQADLFRLKLENIARRIHILNQQNLNFKKTEIKINFKKLNKKSGQKKSSDKLTVSATKITVLNNAKLGMIAQLRTQLQSKNPEERRTALETVDEHGNNVLHIAAQAGNKNTVAFLLTCPFDPLAPNNAGKTARILAKENDHAETAAILTKAEEAARAVKKAADQKKDEVKHEVEQDESKQNSKNKRKAKRAAQKAKKEQAAFEIEVAEKKEKEQRDEEAQIKQREAKEKHDQELRAYFQKAIAEDDDENWIEMVLSPRIPTHCTVHNGIRYTIHARERMAPDTPEVRAKLHKRAIAKGLNIGTKEFDHYVQPRGISFEEVEQAISHPDHTAIHGGAHIYRRGRLKLVTKMLEEMVTVITAVWEQ